MPHVAQTVVPPPLWVLNRGMDAKLPTGEPDWADLLGAVAERRDRAAFGELFGHFAPRLKAYMRRLGADDARAEDLAQEAMLIVWRRATLYDRRQASASTWIFTIARNKRIDQLRRERRPEVELDDLTLVDDGSPPVDDVVQLAQTSRLLRDALGALPPNQAEILRKNFFEDKAHGVIAEELNLPLGTVKSRVRLALTKLRQTLRDMES
jgi:RNA polymerase sigma factor (sigma-70 family)